MKTNIPRFSIIFCICIYLFNSLETFAQLNAELPQIFIDTKFELPTGGQVFNVNTSAGFQTALNTSMPGDIIILKAGITYTGPFNLPNKLSGTGWIYIMSSDYDSLPSPCNRVSPEYKTHMPKIVVKAGSGGTVQTNTGAHHFRFVGIEFTPVSLNYVYNIVLIGNAEKTAEDQPNNLIFDRCYVHGDSVAGSRRGFLTNGAYISIIDSYVSDCKEDGADSQALACYSTTGPIKIVNNYLEGAGENVIFGGSDPSIPNAVPSDIEIRCNHFFKPLKWMNELWDIKNLLEFKNAQRVLVEGNKFENCWPNAQSGFAILFTPRNQNNTAPWSVVQDITFRFNTIINSAQGINISGFDAPNISQRTSRLLIQNNFLNIVQMPFGDGRMFQVLNGPTDVIFDHNTGFCPVAYVVSDGSPKTDYFVFKNNLVNKGVYGFIGSGTAYANTTLAMYFNNNWTVTNNAIIGGSALNFPLGNYFPANPAAVGFVDYDNKDYRLAGSSPFKNMGTDGKDLGADLDSIALMSIYNCDEITDIQNHNLQTNTIIIYPNPVSSTLHINKEETNNQTLSINIFDLLGNKIYSRKNLNASTIDVSPIQNGLYLLQIEIDKVTHISKLLVQH